MGQNLYLQSQTNYSQIGATLLDYGLKLQMTEVFNLIASVDLRRIPYMKNDGQTCGTTSRSDLSYNYWTPVLFLLNNPNLSDDQKLSILDSLKDKGLHWY